MKRKVGISLFNLQSMYGDRRALEIAHEIGADAVLMATRTPARIMGFDKKGSLAEGFDADVVIFDGDVKVHRTIVGGQTVYRL